MAKKTTSQETSSPSFEESLAELEKIVRDLEGGQITLEASLARYEDGVKLLRRCHELLTKAQRRVELLSGVDQQGSPITQPIDEPAGTLEEKAAQRSRRRSTITKPRKADNPSHLGDASDSGTGGDDVDEPGCLF
ncbi:MAG: exodeoxyribonuclease VII small subunit [Pirellulales bacterium]|nr:exodeoxyribonuclease VII small subunit [Pirellulales bacterium]